MAYRRSNRSYKRSYRRRYRKFKRLPNVGQQKWFTPRNVATAARYAAKGVTLIKGLVNSELKRYDKVLALTPSSTPGLSLLTDIDQGSDVQNRDGNSILHKYMTVDVDTRINASATATYVRVIIFADNDNSSTAPTAATLLAVSTNTGSPINVDYTSRYTILADFKFTMSINGNRLLCSKRFINTNFHQKFITGTGSTGYGKNSIWAYYISSEPTNLPDVNIYARSAFYDN